MLNFYKWCDLKSKINSFNKENVFFKEREVWYCYLGLNIGFEQNGKGDNFLRPILILRKFNKHLFVGLPLTTKIKTNYFYYKIYYNKKEQCVILSQIRSIDSKRLKNKTFIISKEDFKEIKKRLIFILK